MTRAHLAIAALLGLAPLAACSGEVASIADAGATDDGGLPDLGSPPPYDGGIFDLGIRDAEPDAGDAGMDLGIGYDSGEAPPGESCETAAAWPKEMAAPFADTTTRSHHREQLSCAGSGAGADAPEEWWKLELPEAKSVVLELGTNGWDGVLATRAGACTAEVETCADRPTALELPNAEGTLFIAVDGFSTGQGSYALSATVAAPWPMPPPNNSCAAAQALAIPATVRAHDFDGDPNPIAPCGLVNAVYYAVDTTGGALSVLAFPSASHDIELAVFSACGDPAMACASTSGRGVAERIDRLLVPPGRWIIAAGTRSARPASGSFTLDVAEEAACTRDAECALGTACIGVLSCAPELGFVATSTVRVEIPDGGGIQIPLVLAGPTSRVARVRARVVLDHPYPQDLVIELRSPEPNPIVVRLRDRSAYEADVTYGRERPADGPGHLQDLVLVETATGTWSLSIEDRAIGDRGFVTGVVLGVE